MRRGLFITIEGPDGSGKSTQINKMQNFLLNRGLQVVSTREPGGTPIGEKIRDIILDTENSEMDAMTETLLYAASRAQHVSQVIRPALERGACVICDRFIDSSIAYQGYGRGLGDVVEDINGYAVTGCMPDVTFLLKLEPKLGKQRIISQDLDRMEQEKEKFHQDVFFGYQQLEKRYCQRIVSIDAEQSIEKISLELLTYLESILKKNDF